MMVQSNQEEKWFENASELSVTDIGTSFTKNKQKKIGIQISLMTLICKHVRGNGQIRATLQSPQQISCCAQQQPCFSGQLSVIEKAKQSGSDKMVWTMTFKNIVCNKDAPFKHDAASTGRIHSLAPSVHCALRDTHGTNPGRLPCVTMMFASAS